MSPKNIHRPLLMLSLASALAFSLISLHAPEKASDASEYALPAVPQTAEVQSYTAGSDYTLQQAKADTVTSHVPDYAGIRVKSLAYAQAQITAAYAQADETWQADQAAATKALNKAKMKAAKAAATKLLAVEKPSSQQWSCLNNLWTGESGWQVYAVNKDSGAYGIAQALPAEKMASAGADWQTNYVTQINWGLTYINSRYGTPCKAWDTWQSRSPHWY